MDRCIDLEDRGLMTPAGSWAIEQAYGYGYQVFHPTPEQEKQMIEEAKARRPELYAKIFPGIISSKTQRYIPVEVQLTTT